MRRDAAISFLYLAFNIAYALRVIDPNDFAADDVPVIRFAFADRSIGYTGHAR